jgi:peptide-methionine (S)-S-oxide reductase
VAPAQGRPVDRAVATFGAGCFWGVETRFRALAGVVDVTVGYMGGALENPSYREVCTGRTGHAEVARVEYDPEQLSYGELLAAFFSLHDPTTLDRQGPDIGPQYRSVIFVHDEQQEGLAKSALQALGRSGKFSRPIVTEIAPAGDFWPAEAYHQRYLEKNYGGYCHLADYAVTVGDLGLE